MAWVVVGLGNPGDRYAATRHNLGLKVVRALAKAHRARFKKARWNAADVAEIRVGEERVVLATSRRYMNECGPSLASVAAKAGVSPERVIAVHDDIDLPLGAMRVKQGGGTAGHNGLKSLEAALGSPDFVRVRLGIGRPPTGEDAAAYVLRPFPPGERSEVDKLVRDGAEAVSTIVEHGVVVTQDRFNRSKPTSR